MESQPTTQVKGHGFFKTFLIAVLACLVVLALVAGGAFVYFSTTNPQALQGGPKAVFEAVVQPKEMPTAATITPEQIACAVGKLGQARVDEIKAGAAIGPGDIALAGSCF